MIGLDLDDLSVDGSITKARAGARWPGAARSTGASRTVTNRGMLAGSAAPGSFTTTDGGEGGGTQRGRRRPRSEAAALVTGPCTCATRRCRRSGRPGWHVR